MRKLTESLDYHDMVDEVESKISVDEYAAKMGRDKDIVTVTFTVNSKQCGEDLVSWLETGYDFVLDAAVSDGELDEGKYLVFVELNRRTRVPERICEILEDLETLTGIKLKDWSVEVDDETYDANPQILSQVIVLSPKEYARMKRKEEKEDELNQMRDIANLERPTDEEPPQPVDQDLQNMKSAAGL